MSKLSKRLSKLSPEQQKLLLQRMRKKGLKLPTSKPAEKSAAFPQIRALGGLPVVTLSEERRAKGMGFSMLFFSGDGTTEKDDKYDFLLECTRFADEHGFKGIWTPERHFQSFGGGRMSL